VDKFGIFLGLLVTFLTVTSSFFMMIGALAPNLQIASIIAPSMFAFVSSFFAL